MKKTMLKRTLSLLLTSSIVLGSGICVLGAEDDELIPEETVVEEQEPDPEEADQLIDEGEVPADELNEDEMPVTEETVFDETADIEEDIPVSEPEEAEDPLTVDDEESVEVLASGDVALNKTNFPDAAFRSYLSEYYDWDGDNVLSSAERNEVYDIYVDEMGITKLDGIEYFTNLKWLSCNGNEISSLDLSSNKKLIALYCNGNSLTSLDVSKNTKLEELICAYNSIKKLDVSKNPNLELLSIYNTSISSIDLTNNSNLVYFCCYNTKITTIDVSGNPGLKTAYDKGEVETSGSIKYYNYEDNDTLDYFYLYIDEGTTIKAPTKVGWVKYPDGWCYKNYNGTWAKGWKAIAGRWYYFDKNGYMETNKWVQSGEDWYYFGADGGSVRSWQKIGGKWYYFGYNGIMIGGTHTVDGFSYYGQLCTIYNWNGESSEPSTYYFDKNGVMKTGWVSSSTYDPTWKGEWAYFDTNGKMVVGWKKISGKWYYFYQEAEEDWALMVTGWQQIDDSWYYFNSDGTMKTGWKKISGSWYYFKSNGVMKTGWLQLDGNWYYFKSSGVMVTGSLKIGNKTYNFGSDGVCKNP